MGKKIRPEQERKKMRSRENTRSVDYFIAAFEGKAGGTKRREEPACPGPFRAARRFKCARTGFRRGCEDIIAESLGDLRGRL